MITKQQMGIRTLIGGFILYIILATYHLFPKIIKCFILCINQYNNNTEFNDDNTDYNNMNVSSKKYLIIIYSASYIVNNFFIAFGIILKLFYNVNNTALMIGISLALTVLSNFMLVLSKNIIISIISSIIISACNGIISLPILLDIIKYFPRMKCISISFIFSGFGIANIIYENIFDSLFDFYLNGINKNNTNINNIDKNFNFDEGINSILKIMTIIICILSILCICLIYPYDVYIKYFDYNEEIFAINSKKYSEKLFNYSYKNQLLSINYDSDSSANNNKNNEEPFFSLISSCPSIQLIFLHFLSLFFYIINFQLIKRFGFFNEHTKNYLQKVENISFFTNFVFYFIWGFLLEKIKFRKIYMAIILIQIFTVSFCYFFSSHKIGFLIYSLIYSIIHSGSLILVPNSFFFIFGIKNGILLFGVSSILINIYRLVKLFAVDILTQKIYYLIANLVIMLFLILAFLIISVFIEKKHVYKEDENQNKIQEMDEIDIFNNDYEIHEINELNDFEK